MTRSVQKACAYGGGRRKEAKGTRSDKDDDGDGGGGCMRSDRNDDVVVVFGGGERRRERKEGGDQDEDALHRMCRFVPHEPRKVTILGYNQKTREEELEGDSFLLSYTKWRERKALHGSGERGSRKKSMP